MLNAIELENFKAFGNKTRIELAPITLIFGENSSGKSSILQALNLLKQTYENREVGAPLLFRARNQITDLGSFQETVFDHDVDLPMKIGLEFNRSIRSSGHPLFRPYVKKLNKSGLAFNFVLDQNREVQVTGVDLISSAHLDEFIARFEVGEKSARRHMGARRRRLLPRPGLFGFGIGAKETRDSKCSAISSIESLWSSDYSEWYEHREAFCTGLKELLEKVENQLKTALEEQGSGRVEVSSGPDIDEWLEELTEEKERLEEGVEFYRSEFTEDDFINRMVKVYKKTPFYLVDCFFLNFQRNTHHSWGVSRFPILPEFHLLDDAWRSAKREAKSRLTSDSFEKLKVFSLHALIMVASNNFTEVLNSLFPMGPFREPPKRVYTFSGTRPDNVGYDGNLMPDFLRANKGAVKEANKWLKRLEVGYELKVEDIGGRESDLFSLRMVDTTRSKKDISHSLSDVGFGLSQSLPFLVQALTDENRIISIEQPEVHIHPRLQADLGDLVAATIEKPYGHQFLIETHSEHLVLRMQKLIRDGKLRPEQVSVIYVSRGPKGSTAERLMLDKNGDFIDDWPKGFFTERLRELL